MAVLMFCRQCGHTPSAPSAYLDRSDPANWTNRTVCDQSNLTTYTTVLEQIWR
jgi:hypothetical protein